MPNKKRKFEKISDSSHVDEKDLLIPQKTTGVEIPDDYSNLITELTQPLSNESEIHSEIADKYKITQENFSTQKSTSTKLKRNYKSSEPRPTKKIKTVAETSNSLSMTDENVEDDFELNLSNKILNEERKPIITNLVLKKLRNTVIFIKKIGDVRIRYSKKKEIGEIHLVKMLNSKAPKNLFYILVTPAFNANWFCPNRDEIRYLLYNRQYDFDSIDECYIDVGSRKNSILDDYEYGNVVTKGALDEMVKNEIKRNRVIAPTKKRKSVEKEDGNEKKKQ